jgi:hypothetical protein
MGDTYFGPNLAPMQWAKRALIYTKGVVVIGASNIQSQVKHTGGWSEHALQRARLNGEWKKGRWEKNILKMKGFPDLELPDKWVDDAGGGSWHYVMGSKVPMSDDWRENARNLSHRAHAARAGNCQEQASVAFEFLDQNAGGLGTFALMSVPDHAFVVISRDTSSDTSASSKWGDQSIILDPWGGYVCTHSQLMAQNEIVEFSWGRELCDMSISDVKKWINKHPTTLLCEQSRLYPKILRGGQPVEKKGVHPLFQNQPT